MRFEQLNYLNFSKKNKEKYLDLPTCQYHNLAACEYKWFDFANWNIINH